MKKFWKRIVDNKMRWQGDIDYKKKLIRINKSKSKKKSSVIDTIVHEEYHRKKPTMHEKTVYKKTKKTVKRLSPKTKRKLYAKYE